MSLKRGPSPGPPAATTPKQDIYRSAPISDRKSVFVAHFSPTLSAKALQAHPDFRSASHRIAAWRKPSAQRSLLGGAGARVVEAGHDDDGEKYAGRRLERVLEGWAVEGAVVVARWYGGVMLGPVRFEHIENCARQAIRDWRAAVAAEAGQGEGAAPKRQKVELEARSREELERVLAERDNSIEVLRTLLAEKKKVVAREDASAEAAKPATPKKPMNYKAMPVQALVKLEKARDATIAFILKQLDNIEDEILKAMGDDDDPDESPKTPVPEPAESPRQDEENTKTVAEDPLRKASPYDRKDIVKQDDQTNQSTKTERRDGEDTNVDTG